MTSKKQERVLASWNSWFKIAWNVVGALKAWNIWEWILKGLHDWEGCFVNIIFMHSFFYDDQNISLIWKKNLEPWSSSIVGTKNLSLVFMTLRAL